MQNKTIIGYTLKRLLGAGGMAEVWYAENSIGKKAAVKILNCLGTFQKRSPSNGNTGSSPYPSGIRLWYNR